MPKTQPVTLIIDTAQLAEVTAACEAARVAIDRVNSALAGLQTMGVEADSPVGVHIHVTLPTKINFTSTMIRQIDHALARSFRT